MRISKILSGYPKCSDLLASGCESVMFILRARSLGLVALRPRPFDESAFFAYAVQWSEGCSAKAYGESDLGIRTKQ